MDTAQVRPAVAQDVPALWRCDVFAQSHPERKSQIERAVQRKQCFVAEADGRLAGFALLNHDFFENGFIPLVVVDREFQRRGIALQLLRVAERACQTTKLFSSTNSSNHPAQGLLRKAGFSRSGVIDNLDPADPEYIYFKEAGRT